MKLGINTIGVYLLLLLPAVAIAYPSATIQGIAEDTVKEKSDSIKIEEFIKKARSVHRKNHDAIQEFKLLEKAEDLALAANDTILYAKTLNTKGLLNRYHQNYAQSIALHAKALAYVKDKTEEYPLANMIYANNAGVASRYNQEYDKAIGFYLHALKIAEETDNLRNIAIACNGLGNTYIYITGKEENAINYFERSLAAEQKRENSLGVAMNYLSISDYYNQIKDFQTSRKYLDKLLAINQERNDDFGLAITYEFYGVNYLKEGKKLTEALRYYQKALEKFKKLNDTHKIADVYSELGTVNRKLGRLRIAIGQLKNSNELAMSIQNFGLLATNNLELSSIYEELSSYSTALDYFKKGKEYEDSLALINQRTEIENLEKKYQLEKKEDQIELLETDQKLKASVLQSQEEKLKSQQTLLLLLIVGLVSFILIVLLLFRNLRLKKRTNKELSVKNKEIEQINSELQNALSDVVTEQKKSEDRKIRLLESKFENKIQELTLKSLESQMNPHFLFNGMNAVRWLVVQQKNEEAQQYMESFAELLRLSLTNNRKNLIELSEEIKTIELYLKIEKLRFDDEFEYSISVNSDSNPDRIKIPPKILQPLIENSIKHGLLPSRRKNKILEINVTEENEGISIKVIDNGVGFKENYKLQRPSSSSTHLGLELIKERIHVHNERSLNKITFEIRQRVNGDGNTLGTEAILLLTSQQNVNILA